MNFIGLSLCITLVLTTVGKSTSIYERHKKQADIRERDFISITNFLNKPQEGILKSTQSKIHSKKIKDDFYRLKIKNNNEKYQIEVDTSY